MQPASSATRPLRDAVAVAANVCGASGRCGARHGARRSIAATRLSPIAAASGANGFPIRAA